MDEGICIAPEHAPLSALPSLDSLPTDRREGFPPKQDMPRERLLKFGPGALSNSDLIALILGSGLPGRNVFEMARTLAERFGSMRALLNATEKDFTGLHGIGRAKIAQLLAIIEMVRRALHEELEQRSLLDSPQAVDDYLRLKIGGLPHEVFYCLYLDARHRLINQPEELARGSLTQMAVYPREIVRRALLLNAAGLIVAHNHPSGAARPSAADRQLTRLLQQALALVDVRLLDHVVVGARDVYSFARNGQM
ncbi:RadC family protein [Paraburkholderia rhizosphaerae]|uniref:DNA replication and repair protein RadC n=1 Tax=Paraburkholderia rhizosphaerae TaxID=480658 RepID=A0A4R8L3V0_9BURK|nr:DNA repair protein RadC [Paraburkholderia rhizosphaerae]TDY37256.1 DNA replication and repair protein RadC [Paraburkholderia rhizosphaerae]